MVRIMHLIKKSCEMISEWIHNGRYFGRFQMSGGEIVLQGLIAGWIFILFMAAWFADDKLRHVIPIAFGDFLVAVVAALPIWVFIVLYNKHKMKKTKKPMVEIEVLE
jgi:hypothetical protein